MKILLGQKVLEEKDANEKYRIACVSGRFKRGMRILLTVTFIITFWAGPYNINKIYNPGEVIGVIQRFDMWEVPEYRHPTKYDYFIGITIAGEEYVIDMDYVDQDWHRLAGVVYDYVGHEVEIKHIDDWIPLSDQDMIIDLRVNDEPLIDSAYLHTVWMKHTLGLTLAGSIVFVLELLFYLREIGKFRIIWK